MTRWDACNHYLSKFSPSRYLEIGVKAGRTGREIVADFKLGVDPYLVPTAKEYYTECYVQTSDAFFKSQKGNLNLHVVLVDGLHEAEQCLRDILNSVAHLHPMGTVVVHDCNPPDEGSQIVPRQQVHWNGDVWKAIVTLRATRPDLRVYTLDADEGLGIIHWAHNEPLIRVPKPLTWQGLVKHRAEWLGLVSP